MHFMIKTYYDYVVVVVIKSYVINCILVIVIMTTILQLHQYMCLIYKAIY
jgi:hypothetical protein